MKLVVQASTRSLLAVAALLYPSAAHAHSPIKDIGTFYNHFLHPLVVPSHALLLIAMALLLGQQGRDVARVGIISLGLAFAVALAAVTIGGLHGEQEWMLLAGALVVASAVSLGWRIPSPLIACLAVGAGAAIGFDSAISTTDLRESALAVSGLMVGVLYLTIVIAGLTVAIEKHWQRIAIRVAGSWILAVSIMVLALSIAGTAKRAATATGYLFG